MRSSPTCRACRRASIITSAAITSSNGACRQRPATSPASADSCRAMASWWAWPRSTGARHGSTASGLSATASMTWATPSAGPATPRPCSAGRRVCSRLPATTTWPRCSASIGRETWRGSTPTTASTPMASCWWPRPARSRTAAGGSKAPSARCATWFAGEPGPDAPTRSARSTSTGRPSARSRRRPPSRARQPALRARWRARARPGWLRPRAGLARRSPPPS